MLLRYQGVLLIGWALAVIHYDKCKRKTHITCVDGKALDPSFAGAMIDENFLSALPARVDPCGENGEFHTFVFDGPVFKEAVRFFRRREGGKRLLLVL